MHRPRSAKLDYAGVNKLRGSEIGNMHDKNHELWHAEDVMLGPLLSASLRSALGYI